MPNTSNLANTCQIPFAAVIQPFAEQKQEEDPIPVIDFGEGGPLRCSQPWCRAYINPFCVFTYNGFKWKCNMCGAETEGVLCIFLSVRNPNSCVQHQFPPSITRL